MNSTCLPFIAALLMLSACKKETPRIDLLTGKDWRLTSMTVETPASQFGGATTDDLTAAHQGSSIRFDKPDICTRRAPDPLMYPTNPLTLKTYRGTWQLSQDEARILLQAPSGIAGGDPDEVNILELTARRLKVTYKLPRNTDNYVVTYQL